MMCARSSSILFDGSIMVLTWMKTKYQRDIDPENARYFQLSTILLRDTLYYFSVLFIVNVIGLAIGLTQNLYDITEVWIPALTSVILSRLLLNLRETTEASDSSDGDDIGVLNFSSIFFKCQYH
ncbi:hypothetical protein C8Q72DRAFT_310691 [Fomitopsis betulina]|nr:hypothetical protein C8Q72DRAFT_310691 [Fomitopsis betulina]